jgi:hypothetical protein
MKFYLRIAALPLLTLALSAPVLAQTGAGSGSMNASSTSGNMNSSGSSVSGNAGVAVDAKTKQPKRSGKTPAGNSASANTAASGTIAKGAVAGSGTAGAATSLPGAGGAAGGAIGPR